MFPAGWNVPIPKNARRVIYSENLSDNGTDFYYITNSDGCIYDIVFQTRMQVNGVPYYIPEHAEFIVVTQSGDILYTVDIPEEESK